MTRRPWLLLAEFIAITLPLAWLWHIWGREAYLDLFQTLTAPLFEAFGVDRFPEKLVGNRFLNVLPFLAFLLIHLLRATMRIRHVGREHLERLERQGSNYILAFWHGRLLMMPYVYRGKKMRIMISRHKDGEYISRTMGWFGHRSIRGSTTRRGTVALRSVVRSLRDGGDVAFTPDGPRGPRFRVQKGVILAARLGRVPIVPVSFSAQPAKVFRSWDRFLLPLPFSRGTFLYGDPIEVPADATDEQIEDLRLSLEGRMRALVEEGDGQALPHTGA